MAGRGDKNKRGTSGRGSSNQSNQPFTSDYQKSNQNKRKTGEAPSFSDEKKSDPAANRNRSTRPKNRLSPPRGVERHFNLLIDSVPYIVKATPFIFNGETRYRVSINGNPDHVFTWDSELKRLTAIDDQASILPDNLEMAISDRLQSKP